MAAKKAGKATMKAAKKKLVCDGCGLVVVVQDACACGCVPACCGTPMKEKK